MVQPPLNLLLGRERDHGRLGFSCRQRGSSGILTLIFRRHVTRRKGLELAGRTQRSAGRPSGFNVKELGPETWPDYVRIMEKHGGVWGGCWCVAFHLTNRDLKRLITPHRQYKER